MASRVTYSSPCFLAMSSERWSTSLLVRLRYGSPPPDERGIGAYFLKDEFHKRLAFRYYGLQQVYWFNLLLACRAGVFQRFLDSLLRFDGETVEIHTVDVFKYSWNPE